MDEQEFLRLADSELKALEQALERHADDLDVDTKAGGIIEIEMANGTKVIINRHTAAREIWVAARSGGFHFAWRDDRWIASRDGAELRATIARCIKEQGGGDVELA